MFVFYGILLPRIKHLKLQFNEALFLEEYLKSIPLVTKLMLLDINLTEAQTHAIPICNSWWNILEHFLVVI